MRSIQRQWQDLRNDPYYDLDGDAARGERAEKHRRREHRRLIVVLSGVLLALMLLGLLQVDARAITQGSGRWILIAALGVDLLACLLIAVAVTRSRILPR